MIGVLGLGFVGLTTALGFASKGFSVTGFDIDEARLELIEKGQLPFHEPYLKEALKRYQGKKFFISSDLKEIVAQSKVLFFCVGTPSKPSGETDLRFLKAALRDVLKIIDKTQPKKTLVIKSSIPPSSAKRILKPLIEQEGFRIGKDIGFASNPEFLREGFAWKDFYEPDRIIIGADDASSGKAVRQCYLPFGAPICIVSLNTAEFIKYLSNTLLASMISFSNEMLLIAHAIGGIDIQEAFAILHLDKRWSGNPANMASYAFPGCGFGGYCLPKDVSGLYHDAKAHRYEATLLKEVMRVNAKVKEYSANTIASHSKPSQRIGILGLSFKPQSDDVRESAAKDIIEKLLKKGYKNLIAYDPLAMENFDKAFALPITYAQSVEDIVARADLLVILTGWSVFAKKRKLLQKKPLLDFRYILKH